MFWPTGTRDLQPAALSALDGRGFGRRALATFEKDFQSSAFFGSEGSGSHDVRRRRVDLAKCSARVVSFSAQSLSERDRRLL